MAAGKTTLTVVEAGKKSRKSAKQRAVVQAAVAAKRKRASGGASAVDGAERMRQAADRQLAKIAEELAILLRKEALDGRLASSRTLMEWAGRKKPRAAPKKKPRLVTYAQRLGAEPPYQEPGREERGAGNREQWSVNREE